MSIQRELLRRSSDLQPSSRLGGSRLNFSDSLAFLTFHPTDSSRIHLDYSSSTGHYSAGSEACASRRGADADPASERWGDAMCLFWGSVPARAMFGIAGREASDAFLGMTEHPSRPSAQLSWDSRAKYQISRMSNNTGRDVQEVANRYVKSRRLLTLKKHDVTGTVWQIEK